MAGLDLYRLNITAPGGILLTGREAADTIWNTYNEAFPDSQLEIIAIHADHRGGIHEGRGEAGQQAACTGDPFRGR
jgi:hypothetical protein